MLCQRSIHYTMIHIFYSRSYPKVIFLNTSECRKCSACKELTHSCPPFKHLLSERIKSLGLMGEPRVPAPLTPFRDDSALRALSALRGLRGAPEVPPLNRETQSLGQQMLNAPVGINGLMHWRKPWIPGEKVSRRKHADQANTLTGSKRALSYLMICKSSPLHKWPN